MTALISAKQEGTTNTNKILKMALSHDLAESRTGDADYLQRQYVTRDEHLGILDIFSGTDLADELVPLWNEFEAHESIESKIVKDADYLDVDFEIREQASKGNTIAQGWLKNRTYVSAQKLETKAAKQMWDIIQTSNPHDWHQKGRNRFSHGDWKKK